MAYTYSRTASQTITGIVTYSHWAPPEYGRGNGSYTFTVDDKTYVTYSRVWEPVKRGDRVTFSVGPSGRVAMKSHEAISELHAIDGAASEFYMAASDLEDLMPGGSIYEMYKDMLSEATYTDDASNQSRFQKILISSRDQLKLCPRTEISGC